MAIMPPVIQRVVYFRDIWFFIYAQHVLGNCCHLCDHQLKQVLPVGILMK